MKRYFTTCPPITFPTRTAKRDHLCKRKRIYNVHVNLDDRFWYEQGAASLMDAYAKTKKACRDHPEAAIFIRWHTDSEAGYFNRSQGHILRGVEPAENWNI